MTTRRKFLRGAASGIVFCSCGLHAARAQSLTSARTGGGDAGDDPSLNYKHPDFGKTRAPVIIDGRRIKTIDVHAHCFFHEAVAMAGPGISVNSAVKGGPQFYMPNSDADAVNWRLGNMDAKGVDMEVLSINPFWYGKDRDVVVDIVTINNTKLAELCAAHPKRFAAFASLALQYPDLAVEQLQSAMKMPGIRGAAIGGSVAGVDFSDPKFHSIWAKAEAVHPPAKHAATRRALQGQWLALKPDRKPARHHDCLAAPDFRRHAR
jgi:aminocarboxymuconate-semialdehyde decarboxylase